MSLGSYLSLSHTSQPHLCCLVSCLFGQPRCSAVEGDVVSGFAPGCTSAAALGALHRPLQRPQSHRCSRLRTSRCSFLTCPLPTSCSHCWVHLECRLLHEPSCQDTHGPPASQLIVPPLTASHSGASADLLVFVGIHVCMFSLAN